MISDKNSVENNGKNFGVMVANNSGAINITLNKANKMPSLISGLVKLLGNACSKEEYQISPFEIKKFTPDEKTEYNSVDIYRDIIKEFAAYYLICENYLDVYDNSNIRGKAKILKCVHMWYLRAKGEILLENKSTQKEELEIIRENSDRIIDMVKEQILKIVRESSEFDNTIIYTEDLELGVECFTCYCFMKCKILEKPL